MRAYLKTSGQFVHSYFVIKEGPMELDVHLLEKVKAVLQEDCIQVYDMKWVQDGSMKILQVSILDKDGKMNIDTCASASSKISDFLDVEDIIPFEYYLEVCSPGAERELRDEEEVNSALHEFIFIKLKNPKDGMDSIKGYLLENKEDCYVVEYMDKAVKKKKEIEKENVALIRLSVKI